MRRESLGLPALWAGFLRYVFVKSIENGIEINNGLLNGVTRFVTSSIHTYTLVFTPVLE